MPPHGSVCLRHTRAGGPAPCVEEKTSEYDDPALTAGTKCDCAGSADVEIKERCPEITQRLTRWTSGDPGNKV